MLLCRDKICNIDIQDRPENKYCSNFSIAQKLEQTFGGIQPPAHQAATPLASVYEIEKHV